MNEEQKAFLELISKIALNGIETGNYEDAVCEIDEAVQKAPEP